MDIHNSPFILGQAESSVEFGGGDGDPSIDGAAVVVDGGSLPFGGSGMERDGSVLECG
jgi:hypothetical protein